MAFQLCFRALDLDCRTFSVYFLIHLTTELLLLLNDPTTQIFHVSQIIRKCNKYILSRFGKKFINEKATASSSFFLSFSVCLSISLTSSLCLYFTHTFSPISPTHSTLFVSFCTQWIPRFRFAVDVVNNTRGFSASKIPKNIVSSMKTSSISTVKYNSPSILSPRDISSYLLFFYFCWSWYTFEYFGVLKPPWSIVLI